MFVSIFRLTKELMNV